MLRTGRSTLHPPSDRERGKAEQDRSDEAKHSLGQPARVGKFLLGGAEDRPLDGDQHCRAEPSRERRGRPFETHCGQQHRGHDENTEQPGEGAAGAEPVAGEQPVEPKHLPFVARDFDLIETAVREWVRQAERDGGTRSDGGLTSTERQELAALRRENRRLREDVEILKRATAFFVKETR